MPNNKTPKILVIDDDAMIHIILDPLIQSYGFEPYRATSAVMAEMQLRQMTPDLILLDVMIPGSDSMALLKSIKTNSKLQDTYVMMISGNHNLNYIADYIAAGADDYVLKPFHATLLKTRIVHALGYIAQQQTMQQVKSILAEVAVKLHQAVEDASELGSDMIPHNINNALCGVSMSSHLMQGEHQKSVKIGTFGMPEITSKMKSRGAPVIQKIIKEVSASD